MTTTIGFRGGTPQVAPRPPAGVWVIMVLFGVGAFPLGLIPAWGAYRRQKWVFYFTNMVLGLLILFCSVGLASYETTAGGVSGFLYFWSAFIYVVVMLRSRDARKWQRWSNGFLILAVFLASTPLLGGSSALGWPPRIVVVVGSVAVALWDVFHLAVPTRAWFKVRIPFSDAVVEWPGFVCNREDR